jgi:hypothetical protein
MMVSIIIDFMSLKTMRRLATTVLLMLLLLTNSVLQPGDKVELVRAFTRNIEFDYLTWVINATDVKINQGALRTTMYLSPAVQKQLFLDYLEIVRQFQIAETQLYQIYTDPDIQNPEEFSIPFKENLSNLDSDRQMIRPIAESILQNQLNAIVSEVGLSVGGQAIPPPLFHSTALPSALIVSPRDVIRQDANISLKTELTLDDKIQLENQVAEALNMSTLVVGIGGVGVYPTMVMQTSDLNWLSEVIAHEWTHNFLTLRPLGLNYMTSPELRTMNETVASIAGKELGAALISRYYPELLPPPPPDAPAESTEIQVSQPVFDFQIEMHLTRVTVDEILKRGAIEEAEKYMELRRKFLWENGYQIRKLNQAYFAFHGAYADLPTSAAGEDVVGAAVRELHAQSQSLADFINRISWMWSYSQLEAAVSAEY